MPILMTLAIFAGVFGALYREAVPRLWAVALGAGAIVVYGTGAGFYSLAGAVDAIYFETLALIFGMSMVSNLLYRGGLSARLAQWMTGATPGNTHWILVLSVLATYGISLAINNLAAIIIVLPVTLRACQRAGITPVPLAVAEIIASNLGGASTMIGDFPNMIIASAGGLGFWDFIGGMMAPCLVLLAATLVYFHRRWPECAVPMPEFRTREPDRRDARDDRVAAVGAWLLVMALAGFFLADAVHLRPGWVALVVGVAALGTGAFKNANMAEAVGLNDILFFTALFVMVGGLVAAGFGENLLGIIESLAGGSVVGRLTALMGLAAVVTIFLNAGPATALLAPVGGGALPGEDPIVWWALPLACWPVRRRR